MPGSYDYCGTHMTVTLFTGRYVSVNSFGFGGVNGHVILEPYTHINKEEFVQGIQLFIHTTMLHRTI